MLHKIMKFILLCSTVAFFNHAQASAALTSVQLKAKEAREKRALALKAAAQAKQVEATKRKELKKRGIQAIQAARQARLKAIAAQKPAPAPAAAPAQPAPKRCMASHCVFYTVRHGSLPLRVSKWVYCQNYNCKGNHYWGAA